MAITLSRLVPIRNGFVKIPGGEIRLSTLVRVDDALAAIAGSKVVQVGPTGRRYVTLSSVSGGTDTESWGLFDYPRHDFFIELPAYDVRSSVAQTDHYATLGALA